MIRALHLASFIGNIGDNANHLGFRRELAANVPNLEWEYTELEIRGMYRGLWRMDQDFVKRANAHDILIIGGGNYFELWVKGSATGTSIDIPLELLRNIRVPVWFNALGVDPGQGASVENVDRFRRLLEFSATQRLHRVSVRNDGSVSALHDFFGQAFKDSVAHVPDGGHFCRNEIVTGACSGESGRNVIAVNLAGDMLDRRFVEPGGYNRFVREMATALEQLLRDDDSRHIVFVPHIFRDLAPIHDVLVALGDAVRRERVTVAACDQGYAAARSALAIYRSSVLTLGMRFHANVCSIGLGTPTIALGCYRQVYEYYKEINRSDHLIDVRQAGYASELVALGTQMLDDSQSFRVENERCVAQMRRELSNYHIAIGTWLKEAGLG